MTLIHRHRDAGGEVPESILTSFQCCLEHGVNRCELDLRLSRDGKLMVIYNPTLKCTIGRRGKVARYDAATLVTYDTRESGPSRIRPTPTPRLEELFEKYPFEHWQLEVKGVPRERAARAVTRVRELAEHFGNRGGVAVASGSRTMLKALNELTPELLRGLIAEYARPGPLKVVQYYGCALLTLNWTLCTPERLLKVQCQGLHASVWTVNEPVLVRRLADFGVGNLIADLPGLASATLEGR